MKRAAIFRAVSSREQAKEEKASLEDQLISTSAAAKELGAVVVADLCIPGQSRNIHSLEEAARQIEAYQQLLDLCEEQKISYLIVDKVDRIGRHRILTMQVYDLCDRHNVYVYDVHTGTLTSPGDDPLQIMIQAYGADRDIRRMSYNMMRGRRKRAASGKFGGSLNYGYYYEYDKEGDRTVKLDKSKAKHVLRIIELYLANNGAEKTARIMSVEYDERNWEASTVYNILRRIRVYAGQVVFGGKWYEGKHEAIIDEETALAVERERVVRAQNRNYGRAASLFSQMIYCEECNCLMVVKKYKVKDQTRRVGYRCTSCNKTIAESKILVSFKTWLNETAFGEISANRHLDPVKVRNEQLNIRLAEIDNSLMRLDGRYVAGKLSEERYDKLLDPLEKEKVKIENELQNQPDAPPPVEMTPEFVELVNNALDNAPTPEVNSLLRQITRATVHPKTKKIKWQEIGIA